MRQFRPWFLFLAVLMLFSGCGRKGNPVIPGSIAPEQVTSLRAQPSAGKVGLSWTMPTKTTEGSRLRDLTEFIVQRGEVAEGTKADDCSCTYKTIATIDVNAARPARIEEGKVYFDDISITNEKTYAYRVIAINRYNRESRPAGPVIARPSVAPASPGNLKAEPDENAIHLSWEAPGLNEDGTPLTDLKGYNLYRGMQKGDHTTLVNSSLITATSYTDAGLVNGKTYYYVVNAVDNLAAPWSEGKASMEATAAPEDRTPPRPPVNVIATVRPGQVLLNWEPNGERDFAGYRVYRSTTPGQGYTLVTPSLLATNSFADTSVRAGETWFYVITAVDTSPRANESFHSVEVTVTVPEN